MFIARQSQGLANTALGWLNPPQLDADRVHDLRVTTKRLRARWLMVAGVAGEAHAKESRIRLRDLARRLSASRDHTVLASTLRALRQSTERPRHRRAVRTVEGFLATLRPTSDSACPTVDKDMVEGWRIEHEAWHRGLPYVDDRVLLQDGLGQTYRKTRKRGRRELAKPTVDGFHEWRKWVKALTYQLELVAPGTTHEDMLRRLMRLGRVLGRHHDLSLVRDFLKGPVASAYPKATRRTQKQVRRASKRLEQKAGKLFRHVLRVPTAELLAELLVPRPEN